MVFSKRGNPGMMVACLMLTMVSQGKATTVLVEAEGFADHGGWRVDQQFMDQMGSPVLLAHGLGVPVKDAATNVEFPEAGRYRVWVRTRDWAASRSDQAGRRPAPQAPGRFQLVIGGKALTTVFGTEGAGWHWQAGGTVEIPARKATVALHDLAGFGGRCDAIVFSTDQGFLPPNEGRPMAEFRRKTLGLPEEPEDAGQYDLVVVGGGIAGICTAISAARLGVDVALIHDRPVLGGNNSSEIRVGLSGQIKQPPYPALGDLVREIAPIGYYDFLEAKKHPERPESQRILALDPVKAVHNAGPASNYEDEKKLRAVLAENRLGLFLNMHVCGTDFQIRPDGGAGPSVKPTRIGAVIAQELRTGRRWRFQGSLFADCTGDGNLGHLAGADYRVGRESREEAAESLAPDKTDQLIMGTSVQWYAVQEDRPSSFPECPWAVQFNEENCQRATRGDWDWETGMNRDPITEYEQIRDHALRVTFGNWAFLKNHAIDKEKYANWRMEWVAYIGGKRESRRLLGDVVLQQQDVEEGRLYSDASVTATWTIDLHFPHPDNTKHFPGEEFRSIARTTPIKPYPIPYRCFYSRNVDNLFMAGRNISVTHVALGTVRVQKTTGMMGEVVGMAASLCKRHHTDPRGVYENYLDELKALMRRGVGGEGLTR